MGLITINENQAEVGSEEKKKEVKQGKLCISRQDNV